MASKYKRFEFKQRVVDEPDPVVGFNFYYRDADGKVIVDQDFECVPHQSALSRLLWAGHWPDGNPVTVLDIISSCLTDLDEQRFLNLIRRKDLDVEPEQYWAIANDLLEQYTARPTGSPASSANGRRERNASSAASSPKPESTGDDSPSDST